MLGCLTTKEEAGPSPIRAGRAWDQDDNKNKGSGEKAMATRAAKK